MTINKSSHRIATGGESAVSGENERYVLDVNECENVLIIACSASSPRILTYNIVRLLINVFLWYPFNSTFISHKLKESQKIPNTRHF
ncbi:hypothetical protein, partial [Nioella sp.]|uniref:hypothetical protein n=1 Tax=Nioella sp. TaxID=1912091 RepID=UPI0035198A35